MVSEFSEYEHCRTVELDLTVGEWHGVFDVVLVEQDVLAGEQQHVGEEHVMIF